jgi:tetratricopeptide (TPR) repeat protein
MMKYYLDRSNALLDSLKINNWYQYWFNFYRYHVGLITTDQYIQLLRTNFNNRFVWPKARTDYEIATTYVSEGRADSARIYYERSRASWDDRYSRYFFDIDGLEVQVLLAGKEYRKAIDKINRIRAVQKQDANVQGYMWSLNLLLQACQGLKDYRAAFDVQAEYNRINDSLTFLNNRQEIAVMEIQKDKEISDRKQREREARQEQRNNLQYLGLGISGIAILILLFLLGLVRAKPWVINLMSFFGFIFIFEFVVLLLDKQIQHLTHDEPWKVLLIKVGMIALIYPLHHFIDEKVSHHLIHKKISLAGWIRSIRGIYKA